MTLTCDTSPLSGLVFSTANLSHGKRSFGPWHSGWTPTIEACGSLSANASARPQTSDQPTTAVSKRLILGAFGGRSIGVGAPACLCALFGLCPLRAKLVKAGTASQAINGTPAEAAGVERVRGIAPNGRRNVIAESHRAMANRPGRRSVPCREHRRVPEPADYHRRGH